MRPTVTSRRRRRLVESFWCLLNSITRLFLLSTIILKSVITICYLMQDSKTVVVCVAGMYLDCMTETKTVFIYTLQSSIYCLFLNFVYSSTKGFGLVGGGGEWRGGWDRLCVSHDFRPPPPLLHF